MTSLSFHYIKGIGCGIGAGKEHVVSDLFLMRVTKGRVSSTGFILIPLMNYKIRSFFIPVSWCKGRRWNQM